MNVHALRHSCGTHLSKAGVAPRTAQAVIRQSDIKLTMNTYTDARLLDTAEAVELLPFLPLVTSDPMVGAEEDAPRNVAPNVAPNPGNCSSPQSLIVHGGDVKDLSPEEENALKTVVLQRLKQSGRHDLNVRPLRPERISALTNTPEIAGRIETPSSRCSNGCTRCLVPYNVMQSNSCAYYRRWMTSQEQD